MFEKIIKIIKRERKVIENFSFLSILQISQLIISFLIYPYLIKILGGEKYGVLAYAQVIISFLTLIVNYGFNATATKQIALDKSTDKGNTNAIINTVLFSKILLCVFSISLLILLVKSIPFMYQYEYIYYYTAVSLLGWCFYPEWYFQGIEKMKNITYTMLSSKLLSLFLIFTLIKEPEDFYIVPIINSLTIVLAGILGLFLLKKSNPKFKFSIVKKEQILNQYKKGFSYFLSNLTANAKDYLSTIIIGVFMNYKDVAIFDLANKIVKVLIIPCGILARALFPKVSVIKSMNYNNKIEKLLLSYTIIILLIVYMMPNTVFSLIINQNLKSFKVALYMLSLTLPLLAIANTRGFLGLVAFGFDSKFMIGILISILVYSVVILLLVMYNSLSIMTISLSIVVSLMIEVISHSYYLKKIKIYEKN